MTDHVIMAQVNFNLIITTQVHMLLKSDGTRVEEGEGAKLSGEGQFHNNRHSRSKDRTQSKPSFSGKPGANIWRPLRGNAGVFTTHKATDDKLEQDNWKLEHRGRVKCSCGFSLNPEGHGPYVIWQRPPTRRFPFWADKRWPHVSHSPPGGSTFSYSDSIEESWAAQQCLPSSQTGRCFPICDLLLSAGPSLVVLAARSRLSADSWRRAACFVKATAARLS